MKINKAKEYDFLNLPAAEVVKRLRKLKQPIRLFGELPKQTILRLRHMESAMLAAEHHLQEEKGGGVQKDDFRAALKAAESAIAHDLLTKEMNAAAAATAEADHLTSAIVAPIDKSNPLSQGKDTFSLVDDLDKRDIAVALIDFNPVLLHKLIKLYLKRMLTAWGASLTDMDAAKKQTPQGKLLFANHNQSSEYLKPLFVLLDKRQLARDVLSRVTEICAYMQQREYVLANDAYLRLSIGNAGNFFLLLFINYFFLIYFT